MTPRGRVPARRAFLITVLGLLAVQVSWMLALPPYAGIDEFDHVFKAEAVAHGELTSTGPALHGRGGLVPAPASVVRAASPVCSGYAYTGHDNCHAAADLGHGMVSVATAADAYNPTFYAVVGTLARPFGGTAADVVMRIVAALLCAALVGWAAAVTSRWAHGPWPWAALAVTVTPVLGYSTVLAGPNGAHYSAGILLWAALIGLVAAPDDAAGPYLLPATVAAVVLVETHTTGPLWLALVLLVALGLQPWRAWWERLRRSGRAGLLAAAAVLAATLASVAWTLGAHANSLGTSNANPPTLGLGAVVQSQLLWVLQAVAAFPTRTEPAPTPVYALWLIVFVAGAVVFVRRSTVRLRWSMVLLVVLGFAVPTALTVVAYATQGLAWQGRYGLPLLVGMPAIAGYALERRGPRLPRPALLVVGVLLGAAVAISTVGVGRLEVHRHLVTVPYTQVPLGIVWVALLAFVGTALPLTLAVRADRSPATAPAQDRVEVA